MQKNHGEPFEMRAKYRTRCPQTGRLIAVGDLAMYFPKARKMYHLESPAAQQVKAMEYAS